MVIYRFTFICALHCDCHQPHTPTNVQHLYKIINHLIHDLSYVFRRYIAIIREYKNQRTRDQHVQKDILNQHIQLDALDSYVFVLYLPEDGDISPKYIGQFMYMDDL